jgi:hypothetical protein
VIRGSCLCGGVRFEVDGRLTPIQLCHAARCQKTTGSAFAPEVAAFAEDFRWTAGEDLIRRYEAPLLREPPPLVRAFCGVCGSPLPLQPEGSDFFVIMAGVLDGDPGSRPFRQIFLAEAAPWFQPTGDLPGFEDRPPATERLPKRR